MKKFFKTILFLGGAAAAAHFGIKHYKRYSALAKLSNSLPEFLSNVYGEQPILDIDSSLGQLSISVSFSVAIIDKHDDIEATIRDYIQDFYPEVSKYAVNIDISPKDSEEAEEESEEE